MTKKALANETLVRTGVVDGCSQRLHERELMIEHLFHVARQRSNLPFGE